MLDKIVIKRLILILSGTTTHEEKMLTEVMFEYVFKNYVEYDHEIIGNDLRVHHEDGHDSLYTLAKGIPFKGTVFIGRQVKFLEGEVYFINNCEAIFAGTEYNGADDSNVVFHSYSISKR